MLAVDTIYRRGDTGNHGTQKLANALGYALTFCFDVHWHSVVVYAGCLMEPALLNVQAMQLHKSYLLQIDRKQYYASNNFR